jgi:hypothetical protein
VVVPVIDAQDVEQLLQFVSRGGDHGFTLTLHEWLVERLVTQACKVQITSVEVHHGPYGFIL